VLTLTDLSAWPWTAWATSTFRIHPTSESGRSARPAASPPVAGKGVRDFSGDGGPASLATLANPEGLAVDSVGHLYISDFTNNAIRKVDTSGIIKPCPLGCLVPEE